LHAEKAVKTGVGTALDFCKRINTWGNYYEKRGELRDGSHASEA
jgi:hypothetical protein